MIYTSYFAQLKNLPRNIIPVSICGKAPNWYHGLQFRKLAPRYSFFSEWKHTHDNERYIQHFNTEILAPLSALQIVTELQSILPEEVKAKMCAPFYVSKDWHISLICYEKPTDFCHRHLVSRWLCENGFDCKEWVKG